MQSTVDSFEFNGYRITPDKQTVFFDYRLIASGKQTEEFVEAVKLPAPLPSSVPGALVSKILESLHLVLGVSYWKLLCPKKIKLSSISLSSDQAEFWNTVYTKGLGEFFFRNRIDFRGLVSFPYSGDIVSKPINFVCRDRSLVGIGGGKDSLVSTELLKEKKLPITGLALKPGSAMIIGEDFKKELGIEVITLERILSPQLLRLKGTYKGHVPVSAIYAFLGLLTAVIYDYRYFIASNEYSASFGNVEYLGQQINHQWSKSLEFELMFQDYVKKYITPDVGYFSLLRPLSEIKIVSLFVRYRKYLPHFTSCNRNFSSTNPLPPGKKWCGECPKCAFMFALLSAFLPKKDLIGIFGKNLFADKNLTRVYQDLLGFGSIKPFDCVGTFEETQAAFYQAWQKKEFFGDPVMKAFEAEILPKIKDIGLIETKAFEVHNVNNMPSRFFSALPL